VEEKSRRIRALTAVLVLLVLALLRPLHRVSGQELHPPTSHRHPDAQKLKNPVQSDAASLEEGRKLYLRHCASCHGPSGKGDGSMALAGGTPANLTDETWDHGSSDGEIFVVIRDGTTSDMEPYKDRLTEKQMWQLVNYLRSLAQKPEK